MKIRKQIEVGSIEDRNCMSSMTMKITRETCRNECIHWKVTGSYTTKNGRKRYKKACALGY